MTAISLVTAATLKLGTTELIGATQTYLSQDNEVLRFCLLRGGGTKSFTGGLKATILASDLVTPNELDFSILNNISQLLKFGSLLILPGNMDVITLVNNLTDTDANVEVAIID